MSYQEVPYTYESLNKHHELNCKGLQSIGEQKNKEGVYGFDRFKALDLNKNQNLSGWNPRERKHYQTLW